ncbi:hypothetical protein B0H19DRAFT_1070002 [Mycena capillaripes]|nr:hypothetical protein B0H19DRAFT_1070002 [Mycena capillaripes]
MFLMTLRKCGTTILSLGPGRTPVISLFLRDVVSIVEIVLWDRARPTLAQIPVVLIAVIGARVVLNIKHLASDADMTVTTTSEAEATQLPVRRAQAERVPWYLRTKDRNSYGGDAVLDSRRA